MTFSKNKAWCKANKRCPCPDIKNNGDAFPGPRHHTTSWHNINGPIETRLYALVLLFQYRILVYATASLKQWSSVIQFVHYVAIRTLYNFDWDISEGIQGKHFYLKKKICIIIYTMASRDRRCCGCRKMEVMKYTPKKYHTQLNEPSDTFFPGRHRKFTSMQKKIWAWENMGFTTQNGNAWRPNFRGDLKKMQ